MPVTPFAWTLKCNVRINFMVKLYYLYVLTVLCTVSVVAQGNKSYIVTQRLWVRTPLYYFINIFFLRSGTAAKTRSFPPPNEKWGRSVLILDSLCLPFYMRDTALSSKINQNLLPLPQGCTYSQP